MIYQGIESVTTCKITSPQAVADREVASKLISFCGSSSSHHPANFCSFSTKLVTQLKACFLKKRTRKLENEVMWGKFHSLRTTTSFHSQWVEFVSQAQVGSTPSPTFYQQATLTVFKALIVARYPLTSASDSHTDLTREEENALRYVAGYICRKVKLELHKP